VKYPGIAVAGAAISTVLCTIQVVVAIGLVVLELHAGKVGGGEALAIALCCGVGIVGVAAGFGGMRLRRSALVVSAALELAWAVLIGGGVLVAQASRLSAADRELLVLFAIPAIASAIAGGLCLLGAKR